MIKERKKEGSPSLKENTWARILEEAAVTEITFSTERRDGAQLFFVSQSLEEKSHTPVHTHTQTPTYTFTFQTEHVSFLIFPFVHRKQTQVSSFLPFPLLLALLPSPPLPPSLCRSVKAFTHGHTHPDTYTPLSRCLSRHLPPSQSSLVHTSTHTRTCREWQVANFYTAGNCLSTPPPPICSPLSLSPCISEYPSTTLNPHPSLRPISF